MPNYITIKCDRCHVQETQILEDSEFPDLLKKGWVLTIQIITTNTAKIEALCPKCNKEHIKSIYD